MSYFEAGSENTDFLRRLGFLAPCRRRNFRIPSGRRFIVRPPIRMILPHRANPIDPPRHLILRITGLNLHFLRKNHLSRIPSDQKTKVPKCCQYRRYQIGPSGYPPFDPLITADPPKPASYSDDINIPHYVASNRIWAGEQRKGVRYNLPDAKSRTDQVERPYKSPSTWRMRSQYRLMRRGIWISFPPLRTNQFEFFGGANFRGLGPL